MLHVYDVLTSDEVGDIFVKVAGTSHWMEACDFFGEGGRAYKTEDIEGTHTRRRLTEDEIWAL